MALRKCDICGEENEINDDTGWPKGWYTMAFVNDNIGVRWSFCSVECLANVTTDKAFLLMQY